jgi:hypothetical protein
MRFAAHRLPLLAAAVALALLPTACGGSGNTSTPVGPPPGAGKQLSNADWPQVVDNPDAYRGATVDLVGRVVTVQKSRDAQFRGIHVYADATNGQLETTIITRASLPLLPDDYVRARGILEGTLQSGSTAGIDVRGPVIIASQLRPATFVDAASPARQRLRAKPYTVYNVTLTPYRIDFAADETRVFLRIRNATDYTIHYNVAQSYLLNDGIRLRPHPHRSYPQMPADLFPGSTATGVTTFRATTPGTVFKFVTRFSSDDIKVGNVGVTTPIIWTWTF